MTAVSGMAYPPRPHPIRIEDLDPRLLLAFRAVAREGTFSSAAVALGYTQSAISQQIAALEKILGEALLERRGGPKPATVTPLGQMVLERTDELMTVLDAIVTDVQLYRTGDLGRIDIGTIQSISTAMLPTILRRLLTQRPGLDTRVQEHYEERELIELIRGGDLDLTFLVTGGIPGLEMVDLLEDPFVVLARTDDVDAGPVSIDQLRDGPVIGQVSSTFQDAIEHQLKDLGCEPDYVFRSADNGVVINMVRAGLGMALVPRLAVLEELDDPRLAIRTLHPPIPARVIRLAWRQGRPLSRAAEMFRAIAVDVAADLGRRHPVLAPDPD